jgi:hypothetical protein
LALRPDDVSNKPWAEGRSSVDEEIEIDDSDLGVLVASRSHTAFDANIEMLWTCQRLVRDDGGRLFFLLA